MNKRWSLGGRLAIASAVVLAALIAVALLWRPAPSPEQLLESAAREFQNENYAAAEQLAAQVPAGTPQLQRALVIAGDAAARQQQFSRAIGYYERVVNDGSPYNVSALVSAGLVYRELGHATQAEASWRRALELDPGNLAAHNSLAHLLGVEGRSWEAVPYFLEPVRQGQFRIQHLLLLGSIAPIVRDETLVDRCLRVRPDDLTPMLGRARLLQAHSERPDEVRSILQRLVDALPELAEAQARFGHILVDDNNADEFYRWHAGLPASVDVHPEIWIVRGAWARNHGDEQAAVRCFAEAVRRDPDHQAANHQLGQTLHALGNTGEAAQFLQRAAWLSDFTNTTGLIENEQSPTPAQLQHVAELAEQLGRLWEAWGWCRVAEQALPSADWPARTMARIVPQLSPAVGRTLPEFNPALQLDVDRYPLPVWRTVSGNPERQVAVATPPLSFVDHASSAGLDFRFFNGGPDERVTGKMQETTGGGVAAWDYDCDGRPDLYFTQGCRWPPQPEAEEHYDRLFRNLADGRCRDVTAAAGLGDRGFGQGISVGDIDSDGFPDLFVANIGANTLYRNNGDGTFSDVTAEAGVAGERWSTSCALADLDADGHCDLYVVNYLQGSDVFSKVCRHHSGIVAGCGPEHFEAAQDQLYRNLGDGRFEEVTQSSGIVRPDGKGLGIVVADFVGDGRPDVYVANDGTANFHFVNATPPDGGALAFSEQALASGLAFDGQGRPQAGMGIAAGDADGDGRLDMFVTNYYLEANTLYLQSLPRSFEDRSGVTGLGAPGMTMLGFGTQFLDVDLNGTPDLVVANGHVHDLAAADIPFAMPPQCFVNRGDARFNEQHPAGDYFSGRFRGRGLARLDWNGDLLDDFAVSHLGSAAALVFNESRPEAHVLAVRLTGVSTNRDAVGAVVVVRCGDHRQTAQLAAGDGYQAVNERRLTFGLGDASTVDELTIQWPGRRRQVFTSVSADCCLHIVEGHDPHVIFRKD